MTPTKKQKLISEQAVYGDLMGLLNDKVYPIKWITSTPNVYHDRKVEDRFYRNLSETMPILRPLKDLTNEITHKGYNDDKPFIPLVELAKIISSEYKDSEIVDFNELTKTIEFYCNDAQDYEVELRKFFYVNSGAFIVEDSRGGNFDIIDHNTYLKIIDLLNRLHFDNRNLLDSNEAISTDVINPYEVK